MEAILGSLLVGDGSGPGRLRGLSGFPELLAFPTPKSTQSATAKTGHELLGKDSLWSLLWRPSLSSPAWLQAFGFWSAAARAQGPKKHQNLSPPDNPLSASPGSCDFLLLFGNCT